MSSPIARRRFLIGTGLFLLAACQPTSRDAALAPVHPSPAGTEGAGEPVVGTFHSKWVRGPVGYAVWRPARVTGRIPVVFCLPGRGGTAAGGIDGTFREAVEAAVRREKSVPFGLAFIDGGESYWHTRASGEDRMRMLIEEFVPKVEKEFDMGGRAGTGIIGWSMGGYGALLAAEDRPELFDAVAVASPALWPSYDAMMAGPGDAFDSAADYAAHDVYAGIDHLDDVPVRVDVGDEDPFYWNVRQFRDSFAKPPEGGYGNGGHSGEYWATLYGPQIQFFGDAFARAANRQAG